MRVTLIKHQASQPIPPCETVHQTFAMLPSAAPQIIGHPDIQGAVDPIGHDIDPAAKAFHPIALKDVGVETVMVRYPREGHGLAETGHVIDDINRKFAWYEAHFPQPANERVTNVQP